jgi:hypothetical protein
VRKLLWILTLLSMPFFSEASQQVSGYISLKCLGGYTYQATIIDYVIGNPENSTTCDTAYAKQDSIHVYWGDGTSTWAYPSNGNGDSVCDCRKEYIYLGTHAYVGPGAYRISFEAGPRVANIVNMTNSAAQDMVIYNTLIISPYVGCDSIMPVILNAPVCSYGCPENCYNFNLAAYSPGGDSIAYSLGKCLTDTGYFIPSNATINRTTGQLTWCNPDTLGIYNFAILITTYKNVIIDSVTATIPIDTEEVELEMTVESNCALGIDEITNTAGFTIYPNPSNGQFTIQSSASGSQLLVLEIYNMLGEKIYAQSLSQVQDITTLNLNNQPSGIYLFRVITKNGDMVSEGKFVIQK